SCFFKPPWEKFFGRILWILPGAAGTGQPSVCLCHDSEACNDQPGLAPANMHSWVFYGSSEVLSRINALVMRRFSV
ncbi:MAG: hypothetical protein R6V15_09165, partial [Desulfotignum sp.]